MFKGLGDLSALMQQARQAQGKMKEAQERLAAIQVEGSAGAGMVLVTVNGQNEVTRVRIEPSLMSDGDVDVLQDLIQSATNDALRKISEAAQEEMSNAMGMLNVPGMNELMGRFGGDLKP